MRTLILPLVPPTSTMAVICVSESTVKLICSHPSVTPSAPVKRSPVMTTLVPTEPLGGEKLKICGLTRKTLLLFSVPLGVVTVTEPVVAPAGTVAAREVSFMTLKVAGVPLKKTISNYRPPHRNEFTWHSAQVFW